MTLEEKEQRLGDILRELAPVAVAFSGGVDSTLLLKIAVERLGPDRVVALTATSPSFSRHEFAESRQLAAAMGVRQLVVESRELEDPDFFENPPRRCYHCKKAIFAAFLDKARELGGHRLVDGSNLDDLDDYRPGREALGELGIRSPLLEAGLSKNEVRTLSRQRELATADKPPFACLASRFPYGTRITAERLQQVARCEELLREFGFAVYRVRYHGDTARIEVALDELTRILDDEVRNKILAEFRAAGFTYVALDLQGYRTGSLNEGAALT